MGWKLLKRKFKWILSGKDTEFDRSGWTTVLESVCTQAEALRSTQEVKVNNITNEIVCSLRQGQSQDELLHQAERHIKESGANDALQVIITSCEKILLKLDSIENRRKCPDDLRDRVHNLVFAASRGLDISELKTLNNIFKREFGKKFVAQATKLKVGFLAEEKLRKGLSTENPNLESKLERLTQIAENNNINWVPVYHPEPVDLLDINPGLIKSVPSSIKLLES